MTISAVASQDQIDTRRRDTSRKLDPARRSALGQFMTPSSTARFMAGMFASISDSEVRLLDAGAGVGSLISAFVDRCLVAPPKSLHVTAWEIDPGQSSRTPITDLEAGPRKVLYESGAAPNVAMICLAPTSLTENHSNGSASSVCNTQRQSLAS